MQTPSLTATCQIAESHTVMRDDMGLEGKRNVDLCCNGEGGSTRSSFGRERKPTVGTYANTTRDEETDKKWQRRGSLSREQESKVSGQRRLKEVEGEDRLLAQAGTMDLCVCSWFWSKVRSFFFFFCGEQGVTEKADVHQKDILN